MRILNIYLRYIIYTVSYTSRAWRRNTIVQSSWVGAVLLYMVAMWSLISVMVELKVDGSVKWVTRMAWRAPKFGCNSSLVRLLLEVLPCLFIRVQRFDPIHQGCANDLAQRTNDTLILIKPLVFCINIQGFCCVTVRYI